MIKLGEARRDAADGKLSLGLSKPDLSIVCPELRELEGNGTDVKGGKSRFQHHDGDQ